MRNKLRAILTLMLAGALGGLVVTDIMAARGARDGLLLIAPKISAASGPSLKAIEEINEEKFMLTYETVREESVRVINSRYQAVLKGTNYTYPFIMNYQMQSGGFFTKDAQGKKTAWMVLNKTAAFEMFGSFEVSGNEVFLGNTPYLIVGTIDDKDEKNRNIYVPAACLTSIPNTFACIADDESGMSEAYIKNVLKGAGITASSYEFINLGYFCKMIHQKLLMALGIALIAALIFALRKGGLLWLQKGRFLKLRLQKFYFLEFMRCMSRDIFAFVGLGLSMALAVGGMFYTALQMFDKSLGWRSTDVLSEYASQSFTAYVRAIQPLCVYADVFLIAFALLAVLLGISIWGAKTEIKMKLVKHRRCAEGE